jgi:outer membrane protein assembly factor BamC
MKRLAGLSALALIIGNTSACSWLTGDDGYFRDRSNDYLESRQTQPMTLPEGVQTKRLDQLLPVPNTVASTTVTDYEVPRPPKLLTAGGIYSDFTLQKNGDQRWLLAQRSPGEVWGMVQQFVRESGLQVAEENPQTREIVSAWQPREDLTAVLGSAVVDDEDEDAASEVRVRIRVEPGVQTNSTDVFVASTQREKGSNDEDLDWVAGDSTEISLLEGLLTSMSSSAEGSVQVSLLASKDFDAPRQVVLTDDSSGNPLLLLGSDFGRAWSSVGRALEMADIRVDDLNRSTGIYYIDLGQPAQKADADEGGWFGWLFGGSDDEEQSVDASSIAQRYAVRLLQVGDSVQVAVLQGNSMAAPADARRILGMIKANLG